MPARTEKQSDTMHAAAQPDASSKPYLDGQDVLDYWYIYSHKYNN